MICVKLGCFVRNALPDGICQPGLSGICPPVPKQELQVRQVQRDSVRVPLNEAEIIHANCAADEVLTGGGWSTGFSLGLEVLFSRANPADPTHEWQVLVANTGGGVSPEVFPYAQCAKLVDAS